MRILVYSLLFIALVTAGGTALLVKGFLETERAAEVEIPIIEETLPQSETFVLMTENELLPGEEIARGDLSLQPWPEEMVKDEFVVSDTTDSSVTKEFVGTIARIRIPTGVPLRRSMVFTRSDAGFLTGILSPGMRAVAVAVRPETGASGFILPGDYVDVIVTYDFRDPGGETHQAAETILENIRVVAVDQAVEGDEEEAIVAATITLEVSPKGAETLSLGSDVGRILLSLRSLSDIEPEIQDAFTPDHEIFEALTISEPENSLEEYNSNSAPVAEETGSGVKVYRGVTESVSSLPGR